MHFDAWAVGGVGGAAALTYIAAGRKFGGEGQTALRLSLDTKNGSLLGDVRVIGGGLAYLASRYATGDTRKALETIAWASGISVLLTEVVRFSLNRNQLSVAKGKIPMFPTFGGNQRSSAYSPQGAWAAN